MVRSVDAGCGIGVRVGVAMVVGSVELFICILSVALLLLLGSR